MALLSYTTNLVIILLTISLHLTNSSQRDNSDGDSNSVLQLASWSHKWSCNISGKCTRIDPDSTIAHIDNTTLYVTQKLCRLSCGRYGALFPRPRGVTIISNRLLQFNPHTIRFKMEENLPEDTRLLLDRMTQIFVANVMSECSGTNCTQTSGVKMIVKLTIARINNLTLSWDTDESYSLDVSSDDQKITAEIEANTIYGARHGLETLNQLITSTPDINDVMLLNGVVSVGAARVRDSPAFPHRGLMLDTSRNFIPVENILKTLDGMASSKLNVFHWHATDSHSFPIQISRIPQMTRYGAYSSKAIYSRKDINNIYGYAKERGIRVILELDGPSHAGNGWQWGPSAQMGDLAVCVDWQPWRNYCIQPPCGQLNPANLNLYRVLRYIYKEFLEFFPSGEAFHMGGDEVYFNCWNSSAEIVNLLKSRGHGTEVSDFLQLWAEYQAASLRIWDEESDQNGCSRESECKPPSPIILWSSHLTQPETIESYLQKDRYIIQTWVESNNDLPHQLSAKGYRLIISTKDAWYLDHGFWGITQYHSWRVAYNNRITRRPGVLGGEVCMWTELVDENLLDTRLWPRSAAAAERMWTDPETDAASAEPRFYRHRQRLVDRGLKPEAVTPKWCVQNEGDCI